MFVDTQVQRRSAAESGGHEEAVLHNDEPWQDRVGFQRTRRILDKRQPRKLQRMGGVSTASAET